MNLNAHEQPVGAESEHRICSTCRALHDCCTQAESSHRRRFSGPGSNRLPRSLRPPSKALETIQGWLAENQAPPQSEAHPAAHLFHCFRSAQAGFDGRHAPPESWHLETACQDIVVQHLRRQAEESFVLQSKIAQRKAQLLRQSAEFASRTLRPTYWPQARTGRRSSRTPSPIMEQQVSNRELIDQLKQMNAQQIVQLATVSQSRQHS